MTRLAEQVLNSAQYFQERTGEGCVCCGVQYAGTGTFCVHCQAPLELSRTVRSRGAPPRFVPVLGASGAGKTVYLGMLLDILSRGTRGVKGLATSAFSVGLQELTTKALESRRFPDKTKTEADEWQWVHCEVTHVRRPKVLCDVITPDFAGEAISREIEQPGSFPAIRHVIAQAHGILLLCDSIRVRDEALGEDLFAMKLTSYLTNLDEWKATPKKKRRPEPPVAIVFTKSDACPEAQQDPALFAANNLPRLVRFCERKFTRFRFFAGSVVGSSATAVDCFGCGTHVPFHIEPRGITEPLEWIIDCS